jgi:hypothetical protein
VFLSHCLLNENVRFPGGATRPGAIPELVADYLESGFEVVEVVGVGGSPSCGVATTLDLDGAVAALARTRGDGDRRSANRDVVAANAVAGRGLFIECLDRALHTRGITVTYREHDLIAELRDAEAIAP